MNNDMPEVEPELVASGSAELWSIGPFDRPARALRYVGGWLEEYDSRLAEQERTRAAGPPLIDAIAVLDGIRIDKIGTVYWAVLEIDSASVTQPADLRVLKAARR
jgi:hypothetical protein